MSLVELFCHVDDFCQGFEPAWIRDPFTAGRRQRRRAGHLCLSEIMTLLIWFHTSQYRTFQAFYQCYVCRHLRDAFLGLVSYGRFVEFMPSALIPLGAYCVNAKAPAWGFRLSTPLRWRSVRRRGPTSTACLPASPNGARVRPGGFVEELPPAGPAILASQVIPPAHTHP